ncbi:MAG: TMEM175 family protein [Lactobacillaceae bacterium]|jgi:uncharacterized membrane protein|nr:TMEM175 family protein [Lactobacillaceae bacterium]
MQKKLKERLDVFSDAVIAILITVMVLELPITMRHGAVVYLQLFKSIGIYSVSFCFIANLWYQHAVTFNEAEQVPNAIVILDLIFLFFLSLIPTFTRLMTSATTNYNVMLYSGLCLIISLIFRMMTRTIIRDKYTEKSDLRVIYNIIYGANFWDSGILYLILIPVGYFWPHVVLVLLIALPVQSFMKHGQEHTDFSELEKMATTEKRGFAGLSTDDQRAFYRLVHEYFRQARWGRHDQQKQTEAWNHFAETAKTQFNISDETLRNWLRSSQDIRRQRLN